MRLLYIETKESTKGNADANEAVNNKLRCYLGCFDAK